MGKKRANCIIYSIIGLCIIGMAVSVMRSSKDNTVNKSPKETSHIETISDEPVDTITITDDKETVDDTESVMNQAEEKDSSEDKVPENGIEDLAGVSDLPPGDESENNSESGTDSEMGDSNNHENAVQDDGIELPIIEF